MDSLVTEVTKSSRKLYTLSESAKRLNITYMRIKYSIANRWLKLAQTDPDLIAEEDLFDFARERGIEIPE